MKDILLLNIGLNNIYSIYNALSMFGNVKIINEFNKDNPTNYDLVVIPGVGSFKTAIELIKKKKFDLLINEANTNKKRILGICLGFQILFSHSYELGFSKGLGLIDGEIVSFSSKTNFIRNIGWLKLKFKANHVSKYESLLKDKFFYHIHSFFLSGVNQKYIMTFSEVNNFTFTSSISFNNITGVQFHPEKSGTNGLNFLKGFINDF